LRNLVIHYAKISGVSEDDRYKLSDAIPSVGKDSDYDLRDWGQTSMGTYDFAEIDVLKEVCEILGVEIPNVS